MFIQVKNAQNGKIEILMVNHIVRVTEYDAGIYHYHMLDGAIIMVEDTRIGVLTELSMVRKN